MAIAMMAWLVAIPLLGMATGLRSMTPIAILCWFAYMGHLPIHHGWAFWTAKLVTAIVFSVFALGEYIGDKLPQTPNRTAAFPLIARLVFGGLCGAIAATALKGAAIEGVILGALGALLGSFLGFHMRRDIVLRTGWPDWVVALNEDAIALLAAIFACGIITADGKRQRDLPRLSAIRQCSLQKKIALLPLLYGLSRCTRGRSEACLLTPMGTLDPVDRSATSISGHEGTVGGALPWLGNLSHKPKCLVRPSTSGDIPDITAIYRKFVATSTATFEIVPPDEFEMSRRRQAVLDRDLPYLVAELEGYLVGFCYASQFRPREGYRYTVEDSIYVRTDCVGYGIGKLLLSELIAQCQSKGCHSMVACICGVNVSSVALHDSLGFQQVGLLPEAGNKFGEWLRLLIMQRPL